MSWRDRARWVREMRWRERVGWLLALLLYAALGWAAWYFTVGWAPYM